MPQSDRLPGPGEKLNMPELCPNYHYRPFLGSMRGPLGYGHLMSGTLIITHTHGKTGMHFPLIPG